MVRHRVLLLVPQQRPRPLDVAERLRGWSTRIAEAGWERLGETGTDRETPARLFRRLRVGMLEAERQTLVDVRRSGAVPHDVVAGVLERIDDEEAMLSGMAESGSARRHAAELLTEARRR